MCTRADFRFDTAVWLTLALAVGFPHLAQAQPRFTSPPQTASPPAATADPLPPPPDPNAPKYTINLSPPHQIGQKFGLVADSNENMHGSIAFVVLGVPTLGPGLNEVTLTHLEADAEVLAVFPNGRIQKMALTVKTFSATKDGKPIPHVQLPAAGAKIVVETLSKAQRDTLKAQAAAEAAAKPASSTATADKTAANKKENPTAPKTEHPIPEKIITVDDQPVSPELARLLGDFLSNDQEDHTLQEEFGPKTPVAVGATWSPDTERLVKEIKQAMGSVKNVSSTFRLIAYTDVGDDPVATVSGTYTLDGIQPPLPPDLSLSDVDCSATTTETLSAPSIQALSTEKATTAITMKFSGRLSKLGFGVKISGEAVTKKTSEITYP